MKRRLRILRLLWYAFVKLATKESRGICSVVDKMMLKDGLISYREHFKIDTEIEEIDKNYKGEYIYGYIYICNPIWYNIPRRIFIMNKILRKVI